MKSYYIILNNQKKGPYNIDELKQIPISNNTLVWKEGMLDWDNAKNIEELKSFLLSIPPPMPLNIENDKTLNVNVINSNAEIIDMERKMEIEKRKSFFAHEFVYFIKCLLIALLFSFLLPIADWPHKILFNVDYSILKYNLDFLIKNSYISQTAYDFVEYIYLAILFFILFHRPIIFSVKWVIRYSKNLNDK